MHVFDSDRLRAAARVLFGRASGRQTTVSPDDRFLVSYPKSGNTWVRFLIGHLLAADRMVDFVSVQHLIPDIYRERDSALMRFARPRLMKSHEYFDPRYRCVIYIVRDPRDVAISYYHFLIKFRRIGESYPLASFVRRFIDGDLDSYGSWGEHVGSWLGAYGNTDRLLLVRYEDLHRQTGVELQRMAAFLGISATEQQIATAIEHSSAGRMRAMETSGRKPGWLAESRQDRLFVRSSRTGGWRAELPPDLAEMIGAAWAQQMERLGYAAHDRAAVL